MELIDIQTAAQLTELSEDQLNRWIQEKKISTHITTINEKTETLIFKYSLIQYFQKDLLGKLLLCEEMLSGADTERTKNAILKKRKSTRKKAAAKSYTEDSRGIAGFLFVIALIFILFQVWMNSWVF